MKRCDHCGRPTANIVTITHGAWIERLCHGENKSCYVDTGTASSLRDWDALDEVES